MFPMLALLAPISPEPGILIVIDDLGSQAFQSYFSIVFALGSKFYRIREQVNNYQLYFWLETSGIKLGNDGRSPTSTHGEFLMT